MAGQTPTQLHETQSRHVEEDLEVNKKLLKYGDTKSAMNIMYTELQKLIEGNPLFDVKLSFPNFQASQLRTLINQRLYKVLNILEFNSTRQNMLIIVRDKDGKLWLLFEGPNKNDKAKSAQILATDLKVLRLSTNFTKRSLSF
ncbi:hypothetical protein F2Q70_00014928 [Brassica cretica]|uniref:Uncharacterized protein n=1 Tax=Brassica cretica TaxID=69181 RepID=A0A8S9HW56_BRACR|nr:hypothetical protein F2Q70_00014928 [Brassica cretica]